MQEGKMEKNIEIKHRALRHISYVLTQGKIPHVYNVKEETITLRNVDMTDVLLELHCYQDEYIADLHDKINNLEQQICKMKCCENCKYHSFWGDELKCNLDYDTQFECLKTKEKWELEE